MKECKEIITIYNRKFDGDTGYDVWTPTVISGVSWYERTDTSITDTGLKSATKCTIRIPIDADFSQKDYVEDIDYKSSDPSKTFTLAAGDVIVRGSHTEYTNPAEIKKSIPDMVTILGSTDSTRRPHGKHFKVVCE